MRPGAPAAHSDGHPPDEPPRPIVGAPTTARNRHPRPRPGGDGPTSPRHLLHSGKPLALLCHAPAATLAARNADGTWPLCGYRMTCLSTTEENLNAFGRKAPWSLDDRLREGGTEYVKARLPLLPFVVVGRNLYTGRNPTSSERLANRLVTDLAGQAR